jgi:hypothetical protein
MAKAHLKLVTPATENRTVTSRRLSNAKLRTREYLTEDEVERLMEAARRQPSWPSRHHDGPCRLPAWPTSGRTGGPAIGYR